jgi:ABC-2 type transport system ATP-binding protein
MASALSIKGMIKRYRGFTLGPLDLELEPGCVLALAGSNGAGKTTTINTVVGLVRRDGGSVKVFGRDANPNDILWKRDIGYVGDNPAFYEFWSGERNLRFMSQFYPDWDNDLMAALSKRFDFDLKKRVTSLSKGNRMKLALIGALSHKPKLLLLDEPTSGLDPIVRMEFLDTLWETMEHGDRAVLYSTHVLSDISRLADEIAFINDGKITIRKRKDDLLDQWRRISFIYDGKIAEPEGVVSHHVDGHEHQMISSDAQLMLDRLVSIGAEGVEVSVVSIEEIAVYILKGAGNVPSDKG